VGVDLGRLRPLRTDGRAPHLSRTATVVVTMAGDTIHHSFAGRGVALGVSSAAAFGTSGPFAKSLLESGWSPGAAVTARISIAAVVLGLPAALTLRGRWHLLRANATMIVLYGLLAIAGCQLFYFNAVETLSVGVALLLEYLGLILVVGWLWVRHGHRPQRWTIVGAALSAVGLVLVLDVLGGAHVDVGGVLWSLGAATGVAAYYVLSARDTGGLPPLAMAAGGMVVGTVVLWVAGGVGIMPLRFASGDVQMGGRDLPWLLPVLGLSLLAAAFAYAIGIAATRRLGPKVAAFLGLTEVLFGVLFSWLVLDELPLPVQLVGGVLILAGVAAVRYEELIASGSEPALVVTPASALPADGDAVAHREHHLGHPVIGGHVVVEPADGLGVVVACVRVDDGP
jgi:drug/metabolite transporter (DMT)-like permease